MPARPLGAWAARATAGIIGGLAIVAVAALPGSVATATAPTTTTRRLLLPAAPTLQAPSTERALQSRLAQALSPAALGAAGARQSCAEVVQGANVVFAYHPELPVVPASNMKLVTATALLAYLGPGYRFGTGLLATAPLEGGVLHGDLYLRGGGDPLLRLPAYAAGFAPHGGVYTNFTELVGLLERAGVKEVAGSVVGDASRYDSLEAVPSWPERYDEEGDAGPLSALSIDDGFAEAGPPVPPGAPPAQQAAGVLTNLLRDAGVRVGGPPLVGKTPPRARLLGDLLSAPLGRELAEILSESDNTAMELLTKELGLVQFGSGSTAAGVRAVRDDLAAQGLPLAGFENIDGSGLSYKDRVTCNLLLAVLEEAGPQGLLVRDLPVAASSGTLEDQLRGTPAALRVHAKTGTLDGVKALSGWVYPAKTEHAPSFDEPVAFATVLNGLPLDMADPAALTDQVAVDLAEYLTPSAGVPREARPGRTRASLAPNG